VIYDLCELYAFFISISRGGDLFIKGRKPHPTP